MHHAQNAVMLTSGKTPTSRPLVRMSGQGSTLVVRMVELYLYLESNRSGDRVWIFVSIRGKSGLQ